MQPKVCQVVSSSIRNMTHKHILEKHGYTVVLGDVYAHDVWMPTEAEWLAETLFRKVQPGSIVICHAPDVRNVDRRMLGVVIVANVCSV